ncbi:MAG: PTS sugar transporter subunit IIA [Acidobacteriota bacterium]
MTIEEAARSLGIPAESVRRWIRQGKIPAKVVDGEYDLSEERILRWARQHHIGIHRGGSAPSSTSIPRPAPDLIETLKRGGVFFGVPSETKRRALEAAVSLAPIPDTIDREKLLEQILAREAMASTGIGGGIAIPHPRAPQGNADFDPLISTFFLREPVPFNAVDGRPVSILFLMVSPTVAVHLQLLSALSFRLRDSSLRSALRACSSKEDFDKAFAGSRPEGTARP